MRMLLLLLSFFAAASSVFAAAPYRVAELTNVEHLLAHDGRLYFIADDDVGPALWRTDGTAAGTVAVVRAGSRDELPIPLVSFDGTLYLTRNYSELRKLDGESGTDVLVKTFPYPGVEDAVVAGEHLLFLADDEGNGGRLWTTDGTAGGTLPISGGRYQEPLLPLSLAGREYFVDEGARLYETDGTLAGERLLAEPLGDAYLWHTLFSFGPSLYFFRNGALRKLSGGAADAADIATIDAYVGSVAVARDAIFFTATAFNGKTQLWKSDGTADGTRFIREFPADPEGRHAQLVSLGDRVVFGVDDGVHGFEPWVTDGTTAGTRLLYDISSGSSDAQELFVADGIAYFAATDELHGRELWQTDGTPEGTKLVMDIAAGTASSSPQELTRVDDTLFFSAGTGLWAYDLPGDVTVAIDDARASESAGSISLTVRLNRPGAQPVDVGYATADDTAKAGEDYTAVSGTLTFAPGETVKAIAVPIAGNTTSDGVRGFFVRLTSDDAAVERAVAGGIIEDDDVAVDLAVSLVPYGDGARLRVENSGASAASNVVLCIGTPPARASFECLPPFVLKAGEAKLRDVGEFDSGSIVANVTQWESDSTPANNSSTWAVADLSQHVLYVHPAVPRLGEQITITVTDRGSNDQPRAIRLISSDRHVITVPETITIPAGADSASIQVTALQTGITIIAIDQPTQAHGVSVFVYGSSGPLKATPILKWDREDGRWGFGVRELTVYVSGLTTGGAQPTGTVEFSDRYSGGPLGTVPVRNGKATIRITPSLGSHQYSVRYSGDANFTAHDHLVYLEIFVEPGESRIRAERIPGTNDLLVTVTGVDGHAPTGTIAVEDADHPENRRAGVVTAIDSARSTFIAPSLAVAKTVYVDYRGDQYYAWKTLYIDFNRSTKGRAVRH